MTDLIIPAVAIGANALMLQPIRGFEIVDGPMIQAQVTLEEVHRDELEIVEHPVDQGANISDHAFLKPSEVTIRCGWSNSDSQINPLTGLASGFLSGASEVFSAIYTVGSSAAAIMNVGSILSGDSQGNIKETYNKLLAVQASRIPFNIITGKRTYKNMLFKSIAAETGKDSENILTITANCKQIILVSTQTVDVSVDPESQGEPEKTQADKNTGQKQLRSAP